MTFVRFALFVFLSGISIQVLAWGKNGHRIVGQIASNHLTETTRSALEPLLDGDLLPEVTTWADEMRSDSGEFWQQDSPRWHYINADKPEDFEPEHYHTPKTQEDVSDLYSATLKSISVLQSKDQSLEQKQFYFRFLTHLIGDIHQPLHAGRAEDRGGNAIQVEFFGEPTNLHSLWDSGLIESQQLSFTEFSNFIDTTDPSQLKEYLMSGPADWVRESMTLSSGVYNSSQSELSYSYIYEQLPLVESSLRRAGIRLAGLLNSLYDPAAEVGSEAIPREKFKSQGEPNPEG